jgi:uncharacterized protein YndB with AHSA1/START domain
MSAANTKTPGEFKTISIDRTFDLPLATVWKAWSEPESFKKWWGPEQYTCPDCTIDFKVGGKCLASMQDSSGKKVWSLCAYKEIVAGKKIVYMDSFSDHKGNVVPSSEYDMPDMPLEMQVTVELEEINGKTKMSLRHSGLPVDMAEDCIKGWQSSFDKLERNLR